LQLVGVKNQCCKVTNYK